MVKVGDRVRFLNSVGGGIVKKINILLWSKKKTGLKLPYCYENA